MMEHKTWLKSRWMKGHKTWMKFNALGSAQNMKLLKRMKLERRMLDETWREEGGRKKMPKHMDEVGIRWLDETLRDELG
jgi:hypothetical protein